MRTTADTTVPAAPVDAVAPAATGAPVALASAASAPAVPTLRIAGANSSIPLWVALVAVLITPLTIALAEEAVYRGYAQPRLQHAGFLVVVAIVFGIQHAGSALSIGPAVASKVLTTRPKESS